MSSDPRSAPRDAWTMQEGEDPYPHDTNPSLRALRDSHPSAPRPPLASSHRFWRVNPMMRVDEARLCDMRMLAYIALLAGLVTLLVALRRLNVAEIIAVALMAAGLMGILETLMQRRAPQRRI